MVVAQISALVNNGQASRVGDPSDRQEIEEEASNGSGSGHEPNHGQQDDEEEIAATEEIASDEAGQTIETSPTGNEGVAEEGTPSDATDMRRGRAHSEAPSIKSPHKPTKGSGAA
jgi:hypothetical protein